LFCLKLLVNSYDVIFDALFEQTNFW